MMYVRFPLSLRDVEYLLFERGIDIGRETVRQWWNRFAPMFAGDIRRHRVSRMRGCRQWRWHLGEMFRQMKSLQQFASIHASLTDHLGLERHPVDRQTNERFALD